jgi:hydrocephalus-inducing protein
MSLHPHLTSLLLSQFMSDTVGRFSEALGFEVVSGERPAASVALSGTCDHPRIAADPRNVFFKASKTRPATPNVCRQFITATSVFEFGPLLAGKEPAAVLEGKHPENMAKLRLTNSGLFDLHADLWLKSTGADPGDGSAVAASKEGGKGGKATAAATAAAKAAEKPAVMPGSGTPRGGAASVPPFALGKCAVDLKVDETIELDVFALPGDEGVFEDVVMCR